MRTKIIYILIALPIALLLAFYMANTAMRVKILYFVSPQLRQLAALDQRTLHNGQIEMSKHKVVVCGITRDNGKDLPHVIKHIQNTVKFFQDYRVIIFENDSHDSTKEILTEWSLHNNKVKIVMEEYGIKKRPSLSFLAKVRNFYLEKLEKDPEYKDFDMVMIVDLDMKYGWDLRGIYNSFSRINEWDVICSNGIYTTSGKMWDMFAFRNKEFPGNHLSQDYWTKVVPKGQKIYNVGMDFVPVDSCFGGLSFYKKSFIKECRYDSKNEDCEHVSFHACVKQKHNGRIFMNPSQIVIYSHIYKTSRILRELLSQKATRHLAHE